MANTIESQTLIDGPRQLVVKIYIASDGASGELTDQNVVDISTFLGTPTAVTLDKIWASTTGCALFLEWDATADTGIMSIPSDVMEEFNFSCFGGIKNNSGTGKTGDIFLSTNGFTVAGDRATIILSMHKD